MPREIALCIPIYKTYELAEDFLKNYSTYYIKLGIDIYYYDSTPDDSVKDVVKKWEDGDHIFYCNMKSAKHSVEKVYQIFQGAGLKYEYKYIWLCNDGTRCSPKGLEQVMEEVKFPWDVIVFGTQGTECTEVESFSSQDEFFHRCIIPMTLYGAVILNWDTMLKSVDWKEYQPFFFSETEEKWWAYMAFYLNRMLELSAFSGLVIPVKSDILRRSELKKSSQWTNDLFSVVCKGWVDTLQKLPETYTQKREMCRRYLDEVFLERAVSWFRLKENGQYSFRTFLKFREKWNWSTKRSFPELFLLALVPKWFVTLYFQLRKYNGRKKFDKFYKRFSRIYIYGAGGFGRAYGEFFEKNHYKFDGYCVTRKRLGKDTLCNHPVFEFASMQGKLADTGIIVAMSRLSGREVYHQLVECIGVDAVFYGLTFQEDLQHESGVRVFT